MYYFTHDFTVIFDFTAIFDLQSSRMALSAIRLAFARFGVFAPLHFRALLNGLLATER